MSDPKPITSQPCADPKGCVYPPWCLDGCSREKTDRWLEGLDQEIERERHDRLSRLEQEISGGR